MFGSYFLIIKIANHIWGNYQSAQNIPLGAFENGYEDGPLGETVCQAVCHHLSEILKALAHLAAQSYLAPYTAFLMRDQIEWLMTEIPKMSSSQFRTALWALIVLLSAGLSYQFWPRSTTSSEFAGF